MQRPSRYALKHRVRVVTAASLFDGHDAAIHVMRRLLQSGGAEVIHLGHNRAAHEVAQAALQEDVQAIAVSSYQGGHMEYFRYLRQLLDEGGGQHIRIFGGGGGVIVSEEVAELHAKGWATRIYTPEDGRRLGLEGMIDDLLSQCDFDPAEGNPPSAADIQEGRTGALPRAITFAEREVEAPGAWPQPQRSAIDAAAAADVPVLGITGTGGAGKSSLVDELVRRWLLDRPSERIAILSVDPTRRRSGGALLGDRIRMNSLDASRVYFRSLATRGRKGELSDAVAPAIALCKAAGFDLVIVETSGIGQGDADIIDLVDCTMYVMTPEYGAPSQLEKIDMLDLADLIAVNKFTRHGGRDALRDVRKQVRRNRGLWEAELESLPVFGTSAADFNDQGVTALYHALVDVLRARSGLPDGSGRLPRPADRHSADSQPIIPASRRRYLAEIAEAVRAHHRRGEAQAQAARKRQSLQVALDALRGTDAETACAEALDEADAALDASVRAFLDAWPSTRQAWSGEELVYSVRGREIRQPLVRTSLSGQPIRRVSLPQTDDHGELVRFAFKENLPGHFPFTGGVFPLKRQGEDPKRMFAGEGGPERTNARFHLLCEGEPAKRLSTAFDSITLYGEDPHERLDIYGKIGESGVSVPHLDAMKQLYAGFDLCAPTTSVSMTINGPAPMLLAMFFNTAIDQQLDAFKSEHGRVPTADEAAQIRARTLSTVRGTVQADILKEDQAQNTCIFSTNFALRMMADVAEWFVQHEVRNFYSVSISGYHIAEAGANPITQLAFTLSNGFTLVEYYLSRGLSIDAFAPNLSFFFSNGLDPEYTVIGRVARRIWAVAMRDRYGASERSQKLKYHVQTSGRSLHAREIQFNDIRTTLQALLALGDHCNSLHTNAYDEAITTPTEESVRRAMAIQLIITKELGLAVSENPWQGSYFIEQLTDLVEEAVLQELERLDERGGVLGAMELQYQRSKIQEESMVYEHRKHDGSLPIVGINTYLDPATTSDDWQPDTPELRRSSPEEKHAQIRSVQDFQAAHADDAPAALTRLQDAALRGDNLFDALMDAVRVATLSQITHALYAVGGQYRRNL